MTKSRLHDDAMVQLLREDPEFAQHYLHQAFADIDDEEGSRPSWRRCVMWLRPEVE